MTRRPPARPSQTGTHPTRSTRRIGLWIAVLLAATLAGVAVWTLTAIPRHIDDLDLEPELWGARPQGSWLGHHGIDGYVLTGWQADADLEALPQSRIIVEKGERSLWTDATDDTRALFSPDGSYRRAGSLQDEAQVRLRLIFDVAYRGSVYIYAVDWDGDERRQRITVDDDADPRSIDLHRSFHNGAWAEFPVATEAGDEVVIAVDRLAGPTAVVSGVFLGPASEADLEPPEPDPPNEVGFAWSGAVTATSATIKAQLTEESRQVRLAISEREDLSDPAFTGIYAAEDDGERLVAITVQGLRPDTQYHYAIVTGEDVHTDMAGAFRTFSDEPLSFTFAFGACAQTGSNHEVFDAIRAHDPLFFLHTGDMFYEDIDEDDIERIRAAYGEVLDSPRQSQLYRSVPIAYVWDDHDFGDEERHAGRQAARLAYQEMVPHYPLAAGLGDVPIYQAFSVGRVRFIVTDLRSERDPNGDSDGPGKSMLGEEQKAWLKQQLLAANETHPVIVWVSSVPWVAETDDSDDDWGSFSHERAELADFIADHNISGLVMLAGDAHMLGLDDGSNNRYARDGEPAFPVFQAAALDRGGSIKGGPYSHGAFPGGGQFGLMEVVDTGGGRIDLQWTGKRWEDGEEHDILSYRMTIPVGEPGTPPRPSPSSTPAAGDEHSVLLVVGDDTELNDSENAVQGRLAARGYDVTVIADDAVRASDADRYHLVIVSKTVRSEHAGATFRNAAAGVLFWEDNAQALSMMATIDDSGLSGTGWHRDGSEVEIEPSAPIELRAGLSGAVPFLDSDDEITYAPTDDGVSTLGPDAIRIARLAEEGDRWVYYAYDTGASLADGSLAAGRRVFFGLYDDTFILLSSEGRAMFDAAVDWASAVSP